MAQGFENVMQYDPPYPSPYGQPLLSDFQYDLEFKLFLNAGMMFLMYLDPSRKKEYKQYLEDTRKFFSNGSVFKEGFKYMFAGIKIWNLNPKIWLPYCGQFALKLMICVRNLKEIELAPEIQTMEIKNPVFVIGLPRSGTTFLHNVLICDEKAKTTKLYQVFFPGTKTMSEEHRRNTSEFMINFLCGNSEDLDTFHVMKVDDPEEDYFTMEMMGLSYVQGCGVPRYEEYRKQLFSRDWQYIYDILRDLLKVHMLELNVKDDEYICMKNVQHLAFMKHLLRTFPNGRFIWIHRDVWSNFKSTLHMNSILKEMCPIDVGMNDDKWFNDTAVYMQKVCLTNAIAARDSWVAENPERAKQFYDVSFKQFTKDPIGMTKKIHEHFGMEFTEKTEQNIREHLGEGNMKKKHGCSKTADDVLTYTEEQVRAELKFYTDRFSDMF